MNYNHQLLTIADTTCTHTHDPRLVPGAHYLERPTPILA